VLARGVSRRQYAHCFVQGLKLAAGAPQNRFTGELVPSFTPFDKRSRRARLDAILSGEDQTSILSLPAKLSVGAAAVLAAGLAFAQAAFAVSPPAPTHALPVAPVEGEIGFGYGKQSKLLGGDRQYHEGVDIRAKRGTPVRAAGEGKIIDATERYRGSVDWGKVVVIDHGHGLVTRYAHLDSYLVRKGDRVEAGDIIGAVGSTGKATGPHLHFEVIEDGKTIDPSPVLALAPASPPRPAAVPSPAPKIKTTRNVQIAPMPPKAALAPEVDANVIVETAPKVDVELNEKHARKLERRLAKLESKLRDRFENFDAFSDLDDIVIKFDDFELEGLDGVEAFSEMLEGQEFHFESGSDFRFVTPDGMRFAFNADLSEEEKQEIRRTHEKAKREAARQMERAREEIKRAKVEAERVRREALTELNERNRERMLEQAERKREIEIERMEREVEREMARAEREIELAEHKHERKQAAKAQNAAERLQYEQDRLEREQERMKREQARIEREQARMEREQARMQKERERLRRELKRLEDKKQDR
jgi:murein DD-endopeptidase MepM/ murein hydrolase activator NlpD